uniref:Uncharacterized protein n=2 Tax=Aegilops tauschii TaxID=37682 RepID=A0A453JKT4_AEGTS
MLMKGLGVMSDDVSFLSKLVRDSMELQAQEALNNVESRETTTMESLQVRVSDLVESNGNGSGMIPREQSLGLSSRPEVRVIKTTPENPMPNLNTKNESEDGVKYCLLETADGEETVEPPAEARR